MILSDKQLLEIIDSGELGIVPAIDIETQLQPASIDLRLSSRFRVFNYNQHAIIDPWDGTEIESLTELIDTEGKPFILHPDNFILGATIEYIKMPRRFVGRLEGRSSIGRLGVKVHSTAGFIDPCFEGTITLEITNEGKIPVKLHPGKRICQLTLMETGPVMRPYGAERGSKYQGQRDPTASKVFNDVEYAIVEPDIPVVALDKKTVA
jgi:dCTP deaminase